jgi:hypothetical protein
VEDGHLERPAQLLLDAEAVRRADVLEVDASITGLPARAPMLPRPSTAVPFVTTATRLPFAV